MSIDMITKKFLDGKIEYHFNFRHLTLLFLILIGTQLILSFVNKSSIKDFLSTTQNWYQKDSAEKLANLTSTSLELLLETINPKDIFDVQEKNKIIQSFNIIFSQQEMGHNIQELCILVKKDGNIYTIDDGKVLFNFLFDKTYNLNSEEKNHFEAVNLFSNIESTLIDQEEIRSILKDKQTFHTFVPIVLRGEYIGTLYMKNNPDFSFITDKIISNYDETSLIYLSLILLGLLAMYFISSYTVRERDEAQKLLLEEHETNLKKQINTEKELLFTKRIYHTHHKAEKVMGFIKEDLRNLSSENIEEIKYRTTKYSNFISRVIYDMKWYDPPVHTVRNPAFKTNLNEVIEFIVKNIFLRISSTSSSFEIKLNLDNDLPCVKVNEFVIWEIIEPLIQNCIEHGGNNFITIEIQTKYFKDSNLSKIFISDNGKGFENCLLEKDEKGIKKLFLENVSTKINDSQNIGYGCFIAYEISRRCNWDLDAYNNECGGATFELKIRN
ncbi:MAG: hypothetical protein STSR0008_04070 [Ignavibacterium sp.]